MAEEFAPAQPARGSKEIIRYVLGACLGIIVLLLLFGKRGELAAAWRQIGGANPAWLAAAVVAEALSLAAFALLQYRVLHLAGTSIPLPRLFALTLANDAIGSSVPGEPAATSVYRYRHYRREGASGSGAGWTIFTTLLAQSIGMALVLLLGVIVALATSGRAGSAGVTVVGLIIVAGAIAVLMRRDLVLRLAGGVVRAGRRMAGQRGQRVFTRAEAGLATMREIPLSGPSTAGLVVIAVAVWLADCLCLMCGFGAVHAPIPWHGVVLAFGVARVAGSLPVVPGGLGIVEGSLAVILVAYGTPAVPALAAALAYRLVSFWLAIAVGWITAAAIAHRVRRER
jgi:hypothetical protein